MISCGLRNDVSTPPCWDYFPSSVTHAGGDDGVAFLQATFRELGWLAAPLALLAAAVLLLWGLACLTRYAFTYYNSSSSSALVDTSVLTLTQLADAESEAPFAKVSQHGVRHLAVIMDGNRRYGCQRYGSSTLGHRDGGHALVRLLRWCAEAEIATLTVFAFSTENWRRDPAEVSAILALVEEFAARIEQEAQAQGLRVVFVVSDPTPIPPHLAALMARIQHDTSANTALTLNVCLSYGSRGEILHACQALVREALEGRITSEAQVTEQAFEEHLLTYPSSPPDLLLRTSGECRVSNFLLYQLAYSEMMFVSKHWPELTRGDFHSILRAYARRGRRYGA